MGTYGHACIVGRKQASSEIFWGNSRAGSDFDTLAFSGMPHGRCGHCLSSNRIPYPGDTSTTATVIQQRTQRLRAARSETATNGGFRNGRIMKMGPSVTHEQLADRLFSLPSSFRRPSKRALSVRRGDNGFRRESLPGQSASGSVLSVSRTNRMAKCLGHACICVCQMFRQSSCAFVPCSRCTRHRNGPGHPEDPPGAVHDPVPFSQAINSHRLVPSAGRSQNSGEGRPNLQTDSRLRRNCHDGVTV
ncbi:hypothetical protein BJY00DRAFT_44623 [Aspergillus carlsbadensis]|nr:hypothetical protein BJY00DRAFT_44623 [Aspergillus carlsbadensis]